MTPTGATILITLTWIVFVIFGKAVIDKRKLDRRKRIHHKLELGIVVVAAIIHGLLCGVRRFDSYMFTMVVFQSFSFWTLFDGILSLLRRKPFFYIGMTSDTDKFFRKYGMKFYPWSKVIALIITIYSVVQIHNHFK